MIMLLHFPDSVALHKSNSKIAFAQGGCTHSLSLALVNPGFRLNYRLKLIAGSAFVWPEICLC